MAALSVLLLAIVGGAIVGAAGLAFGATVSWLIDRLSP